MGKLDMRTATPAPKEAAPFYLTREWRDLANAVLRERGRICQLCGRADGRMYVDHIVELKDGGPALDRANVQVLDARCHTLKTNRERARRIATRY